MRVLNAKLSLAVIPAALLIASLIFTHGRGPFYLRNNFDPEYIYLLNSLSLLTLHAPAHTDHPGTTLQLLGATIVLIQWLGRSLSMHGQPLSESVLSYPEEYLRGLNLVLNILVGVTLYWSAWTIYRLSNSLAAALLLQATVLIYLQTFLALSGVSPEPLLVATGLVLMVPVAAMVLRREGAETNGNQLAIAAGAIFGFGLITKITFVPWAAVILLFPKKSEKWRFAVAAAVASLTFLLPVATRFPVMTSWFTSLLTHSGHYGTGGVGIPGARQLTANFLSLWKDEPLLFWFLGLYAAALLLVRKRARPLLLTACIAILAGTAMVVKHPSTHYLLPVLVLTAFVNAALIAMLPRRWCLAVLVAFIGIGLARNAWALGVWLDSVRTDRRNLADLLALEDKLPGCQIIGTYRPSQKVYALSFASDYSAAVHLKALEKLYPRAIHYDPFSRRFLSFGYEEETGEVKRLVAGGQCVLVEGTLLDPGVLEQLLTKDGIRLTTLMTSPNPISPTDATALYRVQLAGLP